MKTMIQIFEALTLLAIAFIVLVNLLCCGALAEQVCAAILPSDWFIQAWDADCGYCLASKSMLVFFGCQGLFIAMAAAVAVAKLFILSWTIKE